MRLMKTADQPVQRPPAALTRSSCPAEWIGTAQDGASQQAPRTDVDASAELSESDRQKFVRALSRETARRALPGGKIAKAAMSCVGDKSNGWVTKLIISAHSTFEFTYRSRDLGVAITVGRVPETTEHVARVGGG